MTRNIFKLIISLMFVCGTISAQEKKVDMLFRAMQDEITRNMKELSFPGMERPFFIEYMITEGKQLRLKASLGSINNIYESPFSRGTYARVLVGNYHRTNVMKYENQRSAGSSGAPNFTTTVDNNYGQIRRDLWMQTDIAYKNAAEEYSKKMAVLKQKKLSQVEEDQDDFVKMNPIEKIIPSDNFVIDKVKIMHLLEDLSAVFKGYSDIDDSEVSAVITSNDVYCVNSEGSKYSFPNSMLRFEVKAQSRTKGGKIITDNMGFCALHENEIPTSDEIKAQVNEFALRFVRMKNAQSIKDYYSGPVLLEGGAVAKLFDLELFSETGVYATREPIQGESYVTFQEKMNSKVVSNEYTVKSMPFLNEYDGKKLVGHFEMDLEGIEPKKELILIDNGILKNVIGTRMQTKYNQTPSGYFRSGSHPFQLQEILCPGVIDISTSRGVSKDNLKQLLLKSARENGYEYAYIIRKIETRQFFVTTSYYPSYLYRVKVSDGSEELIMDAEFRDFHKGLLKLVLGSSNNKIVVNTISSSNIPMTFICPDAILLPDLEIAWKKDMQKTPSNVVKNPLNEINQNKKL